MGILIFIYLLLMYYGFSWSMVMPGQSREYSLITPFLRPSLEQCNITRKLIPSTEFFTEEFEIPYQN